MQTSNSPWANRSMHLRADRLRDPEVELLLLDLDQFDDLFAELATQDVVTLFADADDLDRLAGAHQRVGLVAREPGDRRVERAAQAALAGRDDEQVGLVAARPQQQGRGIGIGAEASREARQHLLHALGIGTRRLGRRLGAPQLRGGDHLHRLGDLLRRLDGGDAVSEVLQRGHVLSVSGDPA